MASPQHVLSDKGGRELWQLSASELGAEFAARRASPVDALAACLARIDAVNARLNAIVTLDVDGAQGAALASEARWRRGAPHGPLDGIPLTIKDNMVVRAMRSTWGSKLYADYLPPHDELPVARLRAAGAVIVGKTNVPEFTLQGYTDNLLFGPTRNPWNPRLTPGGSSGGAAASVAAGMTPLAVATDGGGSIRRPASHTGLLGFKPSTGRVARRDGFPQILHDFEVVGPIARTTSDAVLVTSIIAGPDAHDQASCAFGAFSCDLSSVLERQRILYIARFHDAPVDSEVATRVAETARNLERLGHVIESGEVPFDVAALNRVWPAIGESGLAWLLRRHGEWRGQVSPSIAAMGESGGGRMAVDYVESLDVVAGLRRKLAEVFTRFDLILTPSAAALPWPAEHSHPETIDCMPVGPRGHAVFTGFANAAGVPGVNIPCMPSRGGLPIGAQLVGRYGADALLLQVAAEYERNYPWADRWPKID